MKEQSMKSIKQSNIDNRNNENNKQWEAPIRRKNVIILKSSRNIFLYLFILILMLGLCPRFPACSNTAYAASVAAYTVKPSGAPYKNQYQTSKTYNDMTRQYYMLRSYLERLELTGGGTLTLTKGTYVITNTLYIPSKVTLVLKDGVIIKKGNITGTTALTPSKSLFQLIAPSKSAKAGIASKYSGETEIQILGEGSATIDLAYSKNTAGIIIGHSTNILIRGITFEKMNNGNFVKIGASKGVTLKNNVFRYYKASETGSREAIALEVPDSVTNSFNYGWSKNDKTSNLDITIQDNEFEKLERAIGSTKYTENIYQKNISLTDNVFSQMTSHAVRVLNWENCNIKGNQFSEISNQAKTLKGILLSGAKDPMITGNVFKSSDRPIQIMPWKNTNSGSSYQTTYNTISAAGKEAMLHNTLLDMAEYIIRYNKTLNEYTLNTEKWEIFDPALKAFTVSPTTEPFQKNFMNYSSFNPETQQYYMLRSYLEQLEKVGGGTLTLTAGTYEICNALYVASDITIYFEDGVNIKKTEQTGIEDMASAKSLFQLVAPSKAKMSGIYGGYDGEKNIKFIGEGTVVIDLNSVVDSIGIVFGHNTNVSVNGITFQNMHSGHFIEMDASSEVIIEHNIFRNHQASLTGIKEAINLDTPDKNTGGFHAVWTNYDCTPNRNIVIKDNYFYGLERAVGTHKYSEGKFHENISILNNTIEKTSSDAIRILNWSSPVIEGNTITSVNGGAGNNRAILASGLLHGLIKGNTFTDAARPIQLMPWKNSEGGSEYAVTYNELDAIDISLMLQNYLVRVSEPFIRVNGTYDEYKYNTQKYYYSSTYISW